MTVSDQRAPAYACLAAVSAHTTGPVVRTVCRLRGAWCVYIGSLTCV